MKKTTAYGRKLARQDPWQRARHSFTNPVTKAAICANIEADIARLRTGADLHAYTGDNAPILANLAGRLVYIVCHAARAHGLEESPEARIMAGTANALADLAACPDDMEKLRGAIQSGLAAIDRLMPKLHTWSLAAGALELDELLARGAGLGAQDVLHALRMKP